MARHPLLYAVRRFLTQTLSLHQGDGILVGCSRGPDSTALTMALQAWGPSLGFRLHAVYVDHALRPESTAEGQEFLRFAQQHGLSGEVVQVTVPKQASLQAAAREARYQALVQAAQRQGARWIAVGHTQDDHAETILLRLLGHGSLRSLTGIPQVRALSGDLQLIRPLWHVSRQQVLDFLQTQRLSFVEDPSNHNPRYLRTRVRQELVPLLHKLAPGWNDHLQRLSEELREDSDCLEEWAQMAAEEWQAQTHVREDGLLVYPVLLFQQWPKALALRVLALLIPVPLGHQGLRQLWNLCQKTQGTAKLQLPGGWQALRDREALWFEHCLPQSEAL